jgi:hypothetical protein
VPARSSHLRAVTTPSFPPISMVAVFKDSGQRPGRQRDDVPGMGGGAK